VAIPSCIFCPVIPLGTARKLKENHSYHAQGPGFNHQHRKKKKERKKLVLPVRNFYVLILYRFSRKISVERKDKVERAPLMPQITP
jgi:hypothetical protein